MDHKGEVYAISRWVGVKAKQVRDRLGEPDDLPSVREAHAKADKTVTDRIEELRLEQERVAKRKLEQLKRKYKSMLNAQKAERRKLTRHHVERRNAEQASQEARIRKGLFGLLDRITGKRRRISSLPLLQAFFSRVQPHCYQMAFGIWAMSLSGRRREQPRALKVRQAG